MSEDRCVCCGEIIAEGRMICRRCEAAGEDVVRQLTERIAELENRVQYHEATIRMIIADAEAEESKAAGKEAEAIVCGNPEDLVAMYRRQRTERQRNAERIKTVCRMRNFPL